jgi:salicylate hydroxylase
LLTSARQIFEKSKFATEIGAALNCAPNGALALQKLGFDFAQAKGVRLDNWETIDGASLRQLRNQDISHADENIGAPFCAIHRNDLFRGLLALSRSSDSGSSAIELVLDARVAHVNADEGIVELVGGQREMADLIVAADGIHSSVRPFVVDSATDTSTETGLSAFRFLMPDHVLKGSEAAKRLLEKKANGASLYVDTVEHGGEKHITWYACRG